MKKLWGGAYHESADELSVRFSQSIAKDLRFWQEDLTCAVVHARMLGHSGIIGRDEAAEIEAGLERMHEEGPDCLPEDAEDIHTAIEIRLKELIGPLADRLALARSRNDQVAASTRLYVHNELLVVLDLIKRYQATLMELAEKHRSTLMPGFTHLQPAQPITLGFYFMAHFWAAQRNGWRAERLFEAANYSPLGSGAMGGTSFPIDREFLARQLGFTAPIPNALDAVSDRSFVLDALHVAAIGMLSLSRLCQDLVLFSTPAFGFVTLADNVTTGSILLPQKRNPDVAELIRGRSAHTVGNWTAFAAMMKGLPLGYNRDSQDDKPLLYESFDLLKDSLRLSTLMLEGAEWNVKNLAKAASSGGTTALDVAENLAQQGLSFREAHEIVGAMAAGVTPDALPDGMSAASLKFPTARESVQARRSPGGPGPAAMTAQLRHGRRSLKRVGFDKPY